MCEEWCGINDHIRDPYKEVWKSGSHLNHWCTSFKTTCEVIRRFLERQKIWFWKAMTLLAPTMHLAPWGKRGGSVSIAMSNSQPRGEQIVSKLDYMNLHIFKELLEGHFERLLNGLVVVWFRIGRSELVGDFGTKDCTDVKQKFKMVFSRFIEV